MEKRLQEIHQQLLTEFAKLKIQEKAVADGLKAVEGKLAQMDAIMQYEGERKAEADRAAAQESQPSD
jgi:hypothetical protein